MTTTGTIDSVLETFSMAFVNAMTASMTETMGSTWSIADGPRSNAISEESGLLRFAVTLEGTLNGIFLLQILRADAVAMAAKLRSESTDGLDTEDSAALLTCIIVVTAKFCLAVAGRYGMVTSRVSVSDESQPLFAHAFSAELVDDDLKYVSLAMSLSPVLIESLALRFNAGSTNPGQQNPGKNLVDKSILETANLKLVMDVELNVTLRFGQRQLTLREVLDLTSGSVIELDRQVEEPVELLLEGKVIARGEAVVIDGNYGLRVTEVSQDFSAHSSIASEALPLHIQDPSDQAK